MGYIEGLKNTEEHLSQSDFPDRQKAEWLSLKDGETVKFTPLQEFDEGSPNYSAKNGLCRSYLEHSNPDQQFWQKKAECTVDEGSCYGCEQGWHQKTVLYVNVLVDDGMKPPYVAILSRGFGKNSVANQLKAIASDEDFNYSITDKVFKFTRTGKTKETTTYSLNLMPKPFEGNVEDHELWDLSQAVFHVEPERQEAYYNGKSFKDADSDSESASTEKVSATAAEKVDVDW